MMLSTSIITSLWLASVVSGHPGQSEHSKRAEAEARGAYLRSLENTDLAHCAPQLAARGIVERVVSRRQDALMDIRKRSGIELDNTGSLHKRQQFGFKQTLEKDHKSKLNLGANWATADWALLGQNQTTVLHPETTEGPYYVSGEFIRKDVREKEAGITVHLDLQVIDIKTCKPVENSAVEIWGTNATGTYSGVDAGPGNDVKDAKANLQNKAMRGIQITNKDGAAQFDTLFPGHYMGRTNHIHVMNHIGQETLTNKTIKGGRVAHVGQIFFDQKLIDEITKLSPYNTIKSGHMLNKNDDIMAMGTSGMADNVVEYVLVGNKLEDGIFAWINFGIDSSNARTPRAAATCSEGGCATNQLKLGDIMGMLFGGGKGKDGKDGKGKGYDGMGMPKIPTGGIPGYEPASMSQMMGPGGFGDLFGALFGGGKGSAPKDPKGKDNVPKGNGNVPAKSAKSALMV